MSRGATLLIIEDNDLIRRSLREMVLEMGLFADVLTASDGCHGYRMLRQCPVDVVLCDLTMPRCDGLEFLRLQQGDPGMAQVPVLVLTGSDDHRTRVHVLEAGASDYICKPVHPEEMRARLSIHLKLKRLHDELRSRTDELERLTKTDALTGLLNRRGLDELLEREGLRASRYGRPLSCLMMDIDHFKRLNDEHGHPGGDVALQSLGRLLLDQLRRPDVVARYGGEEFAVLLPETDQPQAVCVAERLGRAVAGLVLEWEGKTLSFTVSIGVASRASEGVAEPQDLLALADQALYAAKRNGRNRVEQAPAASPRVRRRRPNREQSTPGPYG